jgi:hypothetical protein
LPLDDLAEVAPKATVARGPAGDGRFIENEYYRLEYDPTIGRITRLYDKQRDWEVLPAGSTYAFFEFIHERPDPRLDNRRTALYNRDLEREKFGLSCWQTDWVAQRRGIEQFLGYDEVEGPYRITLGLKFMAPGVDWLEQRLTLHGESSLIELEVQMMKQDIRTPEATYFVFPLNMAAGWDCHFDSAGMPLTLDREQLPGASRDWVTIESFVSVHRGGRGMTLFCPDAPMVQVGDFNFGRKQDEIPRQVNPLLLAWPLNNYWDTNFAASQPGLIRLRYAFTTHDAFDPLEAIQQGQAVRTDVLVHPLIHCAKAESGTFFELEGEGTHVLYVKPATSGKGVIMRLVNVTPEETTVRLRWGAQPIREVYLTTPMEVDKDPLPVSDGAIRHRLPPRQIMSVRVVLD